MELSEADKISMLALIQTPGVGSVSIRQLIAHCGGAAQVFQSDYKKLIRIPGIGDKAAREILKRQYWDFAEKEIEQCREQNWNLYFFSDPGYPSRLKTLYDAPVVLYAQGNIDFNAYRTIGVVGTRQISEYGKSVTETLIRELAPYQTMIVSGLAYGVDITAHKACLKNNLPTIGVMASGLNVIYPSAHQRTAAEMQGNGGIVTENTLNTKPDFMRFPARNRIIAGLSDVIIVVESAKKGGSLITVEFAQNYHRDVFAVPGNLKSPHSEGCNKLIQDHKASIFTSVEQMMEAMGWGLEAFDLCLPNRKRDTSELVFDGFTQDEGQVLSILKQKGNVQIDDLCWQTGMHLNKLATLLLNLEFQGMIKSLPGKKYGLI